MRMLMNTPSLPQDGRKIALGTHEGGKNASQHTLETPVKRWKKPKSTCAVAKLSFAITIHTRGTHTHTHTHTHTQTDRQTHTTQTQTQTQTHSHTHRHTHTHTHTNTLIYMGCQDDQREGQQL